MIVLRLRRLRHWFELRVGWIDAAIQLVFILLLLFMPLAQGAVEPWSQTFVATSALIISVLLVIRLAAPATEGPITDASLAPVFIFILFVGVQLLPLPVSIVGHLSPATVGTRSQTMGEALGQNIAEDQTLTLYPHGTKRDLGLIVFASLTYVTVLTVYRTEARIRRLLQFIAAIGGVIAIEALLQDVAGTHKIYGVLETYDARARSGPFVNHSHFAQFTNLSIGPAIGLLLLTTREFRDHVLGARVDIHDATRSAGRWLRPFWIWATVLVANTLALLLSGSRGGLVSLTAGLSLLLLILARHRPTRLFAWTIFGLILVAFGALLWGASDAFFERLATLTRSRDPSGGRWQTLVNIYSAWRHFPVFGTGLGTHEVVYPMFDYSTDRFLSEFADSDWLQLIEEMGTLGLMIVAWFLLSLLIHLIRAASSRRPRICTAVFGLGFGLTAAIMHSFTDFGQHIHAIAALSAITAALIVNLSRLPSSGRPLAVASSSTRIQRSPTSCRLRILCGATAVWFLAFACGWNLWHTEVARRAAGHWSRADALANQLEADSWQTDDMLVQLLAEASAAADLSPDNVEYRYGLNCYRWRAVSRNRDEESGQIILTADDLVSVHRIADDLRLAAAVCPTYGPIYSLAGQLELFVLKDAAGRDRIRLGYTLCPTHPDSCFAAGLVDVLEANWSESLNKFRRCLSLDSRLLHEVLEVYAYQAHRPDLAVLVCEGRPKPLVELALILRRQAQVADDSPAAGEARAAFRTVLSKLKVLPASENYESETLITMADVLEENGEVRMAAAYLEVAVSRNYERADLHLRLGRLFDRDGRTMDAVHEARICLRLRPGLDEARQFLGELSTRSSFIPDE